MRSVPRIGIDLAEVARFRPFVRNKTHPFLKKAFSRKEVAYCFAHANSALHLAGTFAAKEAVAKALGAATVAFIELEIRHTKDGTPEAWRKGRKLPIAVSVTHTNALAVAIAVG